MSTQVHLTPNLFVLDETAKSTMYSVIAEVGGFVGLNVGLSIIDIILYLSDFVKGIKVYLPPRWHCVKNYF